MCLPAYVQHARSGFNCRPISTSQHFDPDASVVDFNAENCKCRICFRSWTSSGAHQICCLPCGHIFGRSCLQECLQKDLSCPTCCRRAFPWDIRLLYADRIMTPASPTCIQHELANKLAIAEQRARRLNVQLHLSQTVAAQHERYAAHFQERAAHHEKQAAHHEEQARGAERMNKALRVTLVVAAGFACKLLSRLEQHQSIEADSSRRARRQQLPLPAT